ncbi:MAG: malate dehydrogenase, partial [Chloroflexi bacterium]|nr:malate dehydrogenase [Chloroflexota bacterium]
MLKQFRVPDEIAVRVESAVMRRTVGDIFGKFGMPEDDVRRAVDCLLYADDRGIDSHGVSNM